MTTNLSRQEIISALAETAVQQREHVLAQNLLTQYEIQEEQYQNELLCDIRDQVHQTRRLQIQLMGRHAELRAHQSFGQKLQSTIAGMLNGGRQ